MNSMKQQTIKVPLKARNLISNHFKYYYSQINNNWKNGIGSSISNKRALERYLIIKNLVPPKAKILEIGTGSGILLAHLQSKGYVTFGVEPDKNAYLASKQLFKENKLKFRIYNSGGEKLPFKENSLDLIYSFQVIEHVANPLKVFKESSRVLKKNGLVYFVVPNYQSFWEGHYGMFWLPFLALLPKKIAKLYVSLFGRNPNFLDGINFITPRKIRSYCAKTGLEIISMGQFEWKTRLKESTFEAYGSSKKILPILKLVKMLRMNRLIALLGIIFEFYYPIILTARKR